MGFADPNLPGAGRTKESTCSFPIGTERLQTNYKKYYDAVVKDGAPPEEAERLASSVAYSFSGMAFWPKLILDTKGDIFVESRGPKGEHQKSHWQTVLSLMTPVPVPVKAGDTIKIAESADFRTDVLDATKYFVNGELLAA